MTTSTMPPASLVQLYRDYMDATVRTETQRARSVKQHDKLIAACAKRGIDMGSLDGFRVVCGKVEIY
jgi:N-dimethylarginine dimethylaminohydrolase